MRIVAAVTTLALTGGLSGCLPGFGSKPDRSAYTPQEAARAIGGPVVWAGPGQLGYRFSDVVLGPPNVIDPSVPPSRKPMVSLYLSQDGDGPSEGEVDEDATQIETATRQSEAGRSWVRFGTSESDRVLRPSHRRWRARILSEKDAFVEIGGVLAWVTVFEREFDGSDRAWTELLDQLRVAKP